jgi:hypothetical protein
LRLKSLKELLKETIEEMLTDAGICSACASKVIVEYHKEPGYGFFVNYKPVSFSKCDCSDKNLNFVATVLENTTKINVLLKRHVAI